MSKSAVALLFVWIVAGSSADVTPRGPAPNIGPSAVVGSGYTVHLISLQNNREGTLLAFVKVTRKHPDHGDLDLYQHVGIGAPLGMPAGSTLDRHRRGSEKLLEALARDDKLAF